MNLIPTKTEATKMLIITVIFGSVLTVTSAFAQWTNPGQAPTGGNTPPPINAGSDTQTKRGALGVDLLWVNREVPNRANEGGQIVLDSTGEPGNYRVVLDNLEGDFRFWTNNHPSGGKEIFRAYHDGGGLRSWDGLVGRSIGLGNCLHGYCNGFDYETISMNPGHNLRIYFGGTERFVFQNNGNMRASAYCDGNGGKCLEMWHGGFARFVSQVQAASFVYWSDERKKENIKTAPGMDVVNKLRGVTFDWKESGDSSYGLIAQEVEQVLPELVHEDDEGMKSVEYAQIISVLIEGMKEQDARINELEARLTKLEN